MHTLLICVENNTAARTHCKRQMGVVIWLMRGGWYEVLNWLKINYCVCVHGRQLLYFSSMSLNPSLNSLRSWERFQNFERIQREFSLAAGTAAHSWKTFFEIPLILQLVIYRLQMNQLWQRCPYAALVVKFYAFCFYVCMWTHCNTHAVHS